MKIGRILLVLVAAVGVFAIVAAMRLFDPIVMLPGGKLGGVEQAKPANWQEAVAGSTVQLETRPDDPYSVNIWGVGIGPDFYVSTRAEGTTWSHFMDANQNVRLRVGNAVYLLKAERVSNADERQRVIKAYAAKYQVDEAKMQSNAGLIYRLDGR